MPGTNASRVRPPVNAGHTPGEREDRAMSIRTAYPDTEVAEIVYERAVGRDSAMPLMGPADPGTATGLMGPADPGTAVPLMGPTAMCAPIPLMGLADRGNAVSLMGPAGPATATPVMRPGR